MNSTGYIANWRGYQVNIIPPYFLLEHYSVYLFEYIHSSCYFIKYN